MHTDQQTLLYALHVAGLIPALFVAVLSVVLTRCWKRALVPCSYFLTLAAGFALPLIPYGYIWLRLAIALAESLQPAFCVIMVLQCLSLRVSWQILVLIIALPLLGGNTLVYLALTHRSACFTDTLCLDSASLQTIYQILAACALFLLLMVKLKAFHTQTKTQENKNHRWHRYWLMMALVGLNLCLVASDLIVLADAITVPQHDLIATVLRIGFIYLVITSLYRVFDTTTYDTVPRKTVERPVPAELIDQITQLVQGEKLYREMGISRKALAEKLQVGEHVVSRAINQHFGKNFNEYINHFRVEEAKQRLAEESTPITVIAFEVGFSSIASFNRVFKQISGVSPTEHRQHHQPYPAS